MFGRECGDGWHGLIAPLQDEVLRLVGQGWVLLDRVRHMPGNAAHHC